MLMCNTASGWGSTQCLPACRPSGRLSSHRPRPAHSRPFDQVLKDGLRPLAAPKPLGGDRARVEVQRADGTPPAPVDPVFCSALAAALLAVLQRRGAAAREAAAALSHPL